MDKMPGIQNYSYTFRPEHKTIQFLSDLHLKGRSLIIGCTLCYSLIFHTLFAQEVTVSVIDKETGASLSGFIFRSNTIDAEKVTFENTFTISGQDEVQVEVDGYAPVQFAPISPPPSVVRLAMSPRPTVLDATFISAPILEKRTQNTTQTVSVVSSEKLQSNNTLEYQYVLNQVPGVFMQSGTLNTNRITIRGIGARSPFSTTGIRAYFGDIPLTDGNGESVIEDLELAGLSRIEVYKGPAASSFGVGLGGTLILTPQRTAPNTISGSVTGQLGSYGLARTVVTGGIGSSKFQSRLVYAHTYQDGYRTNNEYDRNSVTLTSTWHPNPKNDIDFLFGYTDIKAFIPSSLDLDDASNRPRQAAFVWGRSQAFEDVRYGLAGLTWNHQYSSSWKQLTSLYTTFRNNYEPRPFNILEEESYALGGRSRVEGQFPFQNSELLLNVGVEGFLENYENKTFENLYEDFPLGTGSVQGSLLNTSDQQRYYYNAFAESTFIHRDKTRVNLGININSTTYETINTNGRDNSQFQQSYTFKTIISPKLGFNYKLFGNANLYGSVAHGFSPPTSDETLLPEGRFNSDLQPETGWNYEIGSRMAFFDSKLQAHLALYSLQVQNLLVNRRTQDDALFAINAGKTQHNGIEASLQHTLVENEKRTWTISGSLAWNDYSFSRFTDDGQTFNGNQITGTPTETANVATQLSLQSGWYGSMTLLHAGKIPVNDANDDFTKPYQLLNAKIGYQTFLFTDFGIDMYLGANNISDVSYTSQVQVNARGFGQNAPRFFYPGTPFALYGGLRISFTKENKRNTGRTK